MAAATLVILGELTALKNFAHIDAVQSFLLTHKSKLEEFVTLYNDTNEFTQHYQRVASLQFELNMQMNVFLGPREEQMKLLRADQTPLIAVLSPPLRKQTWDKCISIDNQVSSLHQREQSLRAQLKAWLEWLVDQKDEWAAIKEQTRMDFRKNFMAILPSSAN